MHRRLALAILLSVALSCVACRPQPRNGNALPASVAPAPTVDELARATETATAIPTTAFPSSTPAPLSTPLPSVTASLTPTATPTAPVLRRIAVPSAWELEVQEAVTALENREQWQIVIAGEPAQLLQEGQVDAALAVDGAIAAGAMAGAESYAAGQRPLALTVPFQHEWDGVTLAEAIEIRESGHPFVVALPWDELTPARRALRIDGVHIADPDYPLQQQWLLYVTAEAGKSAAPLATALQGAAGARDVQLAAVGDIMLDRQLGAAIAGGDLAFPFLFVADLLQSADFTIGNFESALGDVGQPASKSYTFRAPPAAARSMALAGFDLVTLANNHALDYGPDALLQGLGLFEEAGVATVGAGANLDEAREPYLAVVNGIQFGFLAYVAVPVEGRAPYFDTASWTAGDDAPGLAWADPDLVAADVRALRETVDHVVVNLHSGYEYLAAPSPEQMAAARAAIDAGATLVVGHHAHILQGVEFRGEGAIAYGLGNFAFNITGPPQTAILNAWFDENGLRQLDFYAAVIQGSGQPAPASVEDDAAIRRQIFSLSGPLN